MSGGDERPHPDKAAGESGEARTGGRTEPEPSGASTQGPPEAAPVWWPGQVADGGVPATSTPLPSPAAPPAGMTPVALPAEAAPPWWPGNGNPEPVPQTPGYYPQAEPVHRLSPLTLVTEPVRYLKNLLIPIAVALFVGTSNPVALAGALLALCGCVVGGVVTYQTFRYQVGSERLEIRQGLISRSRRTIPLERIRGVDVTSTLLHRALGLAVVKVEAAAGGGGAEEGKLDAVTQAEADRLRQVLLNRREALLEEAGTEGPGGEPSAQHAGEHATSRASDAADRTYFTMPPRWYFYGALSPGYLLTPFIALAALLGLLAQGLGEVRVEAEEVRGVWEWLAAEPEFSLLTAAVGIGLVLLLLMPTFAVVSYAVNNWGFTLLRRDNSLVAERGLFTRRSVTLELRRIRGHEISDTPLERLRAAARLRAIVTGLGEVSTRAALLPIGARARVEEVAAQALTPFRGDLAPHPPAALARRLFRATVPFLAIGALSLAAGYPGIAIPAFVLAVFGIPLGLDRYRSLGHGYDGRSVSVRSGSLKRDQAVVSRDAVIGWRWRQTIFQRRSELATLVVTVGAGSGGYAAIDAGFEESVVFADGITPDMLRPFRQKPESHETTPG